MEYADFKLRGTAAHKGKYTYPEWDRPYLAKEKVRIICPVHGEFLQQVNLHVHQNPCGCRKCGMERSWNKTRTTFSGFVSKASKKHKGKYSYPEQEIANVFTKLDINCPEHGVFSQTVMSHLAGKGCRLCSAGAGSDKTRMTFSVFVARSSKRHEDKYSYPEQVLANGRTKLNIVCPEHGVFSQEAASHLAGRGCPHCAELQRVKTKRKSFDEFLRRARKKHGDRFSYEEPEEFMGMGSLIKITCPDHGLFEQRADVHIRGSFACPKCSQAHIGAISRAPDSDIEASLSRMHGGQPWTYIGRSESGRVVLTCSREFPTGKPHGRFTMLACNFSAGKGCPACAKVRSRAEDEVRDFVRGLGFSTFKGNNRTVPGLGRYQLDIVVPERKLAIEYNGVVWHSELFSNNRDAHVNKTELAESLGFRLIQVFEDEWEHNKEATKLRLQAILGVGLDRVYARNTELKELGWTAARDFLTKYHLQGAGSVAKYSLGLFSEGELVAVATFGRARYSDSDAWELFRFASACRVVGGAGKLIAGFKRLFHPEGWLVSYADRRWSIGGLYQAIGFEFDGVTAPGYAYTKGSMRYSREKFQKHKLSTVLPKFDPELTEVENCRRNGFHRIFDCGHSRWRLNLSV